ncbi:MAG TPA: prolyl aminopeptidase, partial [Gammaproteobacteria bacterium]|nr:prolyl aminopeptidase [Gammaproteobacteria bacterium]
MSFIEHRLGRTHFTAKGKTTDRLPVIWLHGGPGGTHNPNGNVFKLSENRKVYAYTQLGSGKSSDLSQRRLRISTFVQELQLLVAAWGLKDFHLMGGSWGTTLALEYYLKVGGRGIRSMVLQSPMLSAVDWQKDANRLIKA